MARGSKYSDHFAAEVLAQADLSATPSEVVKSFSVPYRTYTDWLSRAESDLNFAKLRLEKRKEFEKEWKRFALSSLRKAFQKSQELIGKCDQPEHLEYLNAHIKTVGELAVNIEVLNDFDQGETETTQGHTASQGSTRA